jgi:branched-chain amino acid transport system permease protein
VNLAHGAFYAIGAYLAITIGQRLGFTAAVFMAPIAVGILGVIVERLLLRRFYKADPALSLLLTFGLAMVIEQVLRMIYGAPPLSWAIPQELRGQFIVGDFFYPRYRALLMLIAMLCVAGLWFLLQRTPFGRVVRAGVQNPDMVGALGISLEPVHGGDRFPRHRACGPRRRDAGADLRGAPGDGRRDHHRGLRGRW